MQFYAVRYTIRYMLPLIIFIVGLGPLTSALAHGPKGHGEQSFTAFQAIQKSSQLFDKLLAKKKLDPGFESDLKRIEVTRRSRNDQTEFVVQFERTQGDPQSVYIFFDATGKYVGSNFTGK